MSITSQLCDECSTGYHLSEDSSSCDQDPDGIPGCIYYLEDLVCIECAENHYLENNECKSVPEGNRVENCFNYSNIEDCWKCADTFVLINNKCVTPIVENCSVYISPTMCETCVNGYGIKFENNLRVCALR